MALIVCALNGPFPGEIFMQLITIASTGGVALAVAQAQEFFRREWGPVAHRFLATFEEKTRGRGYFGDIMTHACGRATEALHRRLENICYDVDLFLSGDPVSLGNEIVRRPPIATEYVLPDGRSRFASTTLQNFEALLTWNAQHQFVGQHYRDGTMRATIDLEEHPCPHAQSCELRGTGRFDSRVCLTRPWRLASFHEVVCSYGVGMLQLVGEGRAPRVHEDESDISVDVDAIVRHRAYMIWLERGRPIGDDLADWYAARRMLGLDG